jgi:hypothetical protein
MRKSLLLTMTLAWSVIGHGQQSATEWAVYADRLGATGPMGTLATKGGLIFSARGDTAFYAFDATRD